LRLLLAIALAGCAAPDPNELFSGLDVSVVDATGASDAVVALIKGADTSVHIALPNGEDLAIADALIDAYEVGVEVEVVTDVDLEAEPAIAALLAADVPVALDDGAISYFDFAYNVDVGWASEDVLMTHSYAIADRQQVLASTRSGSLGTGDRVLLGLRGEEFVEDLLSEHNQMFEGIDATATTAYDGLAKSIVDNRWIYGTTDEVMVELWFGPQERLTKRVIDSIYAARSSVWVLSNDIANDGLAHALQDKAEWGFDMQVVVGPDFASSASLLSRVLENETPDVLKSQRTDVEVLPTVVIVDAADGADGRHYTTRAFILTHDLYSSARLYRGIEVKNDQLLDGTLLTVVDTYGTSSAIATLTAMFDEHSAAAEAL
jgi:hypothetical protein